MKDARFFRYVLTGGTAACVDLGGFILLMWIGMPLVAAAAASFALAAVVNFRLSAVYVFQTRGDLRRFALFFIFAVLGLLINAGVTVWCVQIAGFPASIAKLTGIGVAFLFNFSVNAAIVFRRDAPGKA